MAWVTISKDDLRNYVVSALVDAIDEAALGDSQTDRFTLVQADTLAEVRMAVASSSENVLDSDATKIPQSLRSACAWLIAAYMAKGLGIELTEQQTAEIEAARQKLERVASGDLTVEVPDATDTTPDSQAGSGVELVTYSDRSFTADTMAGL